MEENFNIFSNQQQFDELEITCDDELNLEFAKEVKAEATELASKKEEVEQILQFIDLTTLAGDDTQQRVESLISDALSPIEKSEGIKCAAICIYPARIVGAVEYVKRMNSSLPIASVAGGFPSGQYRLETRIQEIELAVLDGANEIDAVINRAAVLEGDWRLLFDEIVEMKRACLEKATLKMILSTGELGNSANIYKAAIVAMSAGADFIKTSTGKEAINATPESAFIMCRAIKRFYQLTNIRVGFKAAGGIRTHEDAIKYKLLVQKVLGDEWMTPKLFRIGASRGLLDNIRSALSKFT